MMKKFLFTLSAALFLFTACDDNEGDHNKGEIRIPDKGQTDQSFYANQLTGTIGINADSDWISEITATATRATSPNWIRITPSNGKAGSQNITISMDTNYSGEERTATIHLKSGATTQKVKVVQKATKEDGTDPETPGVVSPDAKMVDKIKIVYQYGPFTDPENYEMSFMYDDAKRLTGMTYKDIDEGSVMAEATLKYSGNKVALYFFNKTYWDTDEPGVDPSGEPKEVRMAVGQKSAKKRNVWQRKNRGSMTRSGASELTGTWVVNATVELDEDGYVVSGESVEQETFRDKKWEYEYIWKASYKEGYVQSVSYYDVEDDEDLYYECKWTNNNLTYIGGSWYYGTATYTTHENSRLTNLDINNLIYQEEYFSTGIDRYSLFNFAGLYGKRSANYIAKGADSYGHYESDYNYKFDSDGCPTEVVISYSSSEDETSTFYIQYK